MTTFPVRVAGRRQETEDTVSLSLEVPPELRTAFSYRPGQFLTIEEVLGGATLRRQYSLSSAPDLDDLARITVKRVPEGRMSKWLIDEVRIGDLLEAAPPRGRLYVPSNEPRHYVLLAAGSGIAPLIGIGRHVLGEETDHRVTLAYGNRMPESIILREEVDRLSEQGARVEHVLSRPPVDWDGPRGRVDPTYLTDRWPAWHSDELPVSVFLCGPAGFMSAAETFLVTQGVDLDDIRRESFDLSLNEGDWKDEEQLVIAAAEANGEGRECGLLTARVDGEEIDVTPVSGETLLAALLREDADVPFSCQEGTCGSCLARLQEGSVDMGARALQLLREGDLRDRLILTCMSRPRTENVTVDFDDII
jgi:ferredoxin-NADP reductase